MSVSSSVGVSPNYVLSPMSRLSANGTQAPSANAFDLDDGVGQSDLTSGPNPLPPAVAGPPFSPDTLAALMNVQEQQPNGNPSVPDSSQATSGEMSSSDFESVFQSNAETPKAEDLVNLFGTNGDESQTPATVQASFARHPDSQHQVDLGQVSNDVPDKQAATNDSSTSSNGSGTSISDLLKLLQMQSIAVNQSPALIQILANL